MKPNRILALETSSPLCGVAVLACPGRPRTAEEALRVGAVFQRTGESRFARHSDILYGLIDGVLREARCGFADLTGVAVSLGPGSFTGLRIGLAAAKVFARFGNLPLAGVPTLEAMAVEAALAGPADAYVPTVDANRGDRYVAVYRPGRGGPALVRGPWAGPAEGIDAAVPPGGRRVDAPPAAGTVAALGLVRVLRGRTGHAGALVPLYVRRPEPVERRRREQGRGG